MADALRPADDVIENIASEAREKAAETRVCETAPVSHSHSPWNADWLEAVLEKGWEESCRTHPRGMRLFCTDCAHKPGCERPVCGQCVEGEHEHHRVVKVKSCGVCAVYFCCHA